MNPEDVGRILDEIGERIGPAGEYAWHLTVRQVLIDGALLTAAAFIVLSLAVALVLIVRRYNARVKARRASDSYYRRSESDGIEWAGCVFIVLTGLFPLVLGLMNLLNPEYHAMIRLLERVIP